MAPPLTPAFLRLPPELGSRIYTHHLTSPPPPFLLTPTLKPPALLSDNRQIRGESSGIFDSSTIFQFDNPSHRAMIPEIRYDCSEVWLDACSWRRAFLDLPGLDEDDKLGKLRQRLAERGVFLRCEVLKAGIRVNGRLVWTTDPLSEAREAVERWEVGGEGDVCLR